LCADENTIISEKPIQRGSTLQKALIMLKRGVKKATEELLNSEKHVVSVNEKTFLEKFSRYLTKKFEEYSIMSVDSLLT
jgi:hypothetical protein